MRLGGKPAPTTNGPACSAKETGQFLQGSGKLQRDF